MLSLLSVWLGLASLVYALAILVRRSLFNDLAVTVTLYAAIFSLTFAGLTLWDLRKQGVQEPGVQARRTQAWVATCLSITAIAVVYLLIAKAQVVPRSS